MSNLYTQKNQFRLYDMNGVVLGAGDYILIREPDGFDTIPIKLERDRNTHGVFFEFGDENQPLGFDRPMKISGEPEDPYSLIKEIYDTDGVDGRLEFEFLNWNGSIYVSQYRSNLDLESISIIDYKISVNCRRVLLSDKFRTRLETPVNFGSTTSIDGTAIGGLTEESVFMHSKELHFDFVSDDSDFPVLVNSLAYSIDSSVDSYYTPVGFFQITKNAIKDNNQPLRGFSLVPQPQFTVNGGGRLIINDVKVRKMISKTVGSSATIGLYYRVGLDGVDNLIGSTLALGNGSSTNTNFQVTESNVVVNIPIPTAKVPNNIYIHIRVDFDSTGATLNMFDATFNIVPVYVKDDVLDASLISVDKSSFVDFYDTFDSVNHILETINDSNGILESSFLSNQMSSIYVSNGYKIRELNDKDVITSFKEIFNGWLAPSFGLGYAIYDDSGTFKVLMERYSEFYQDDEVDYIENIEDGSFEIKTDKEYRFNEIKIGYKNYPKSTDENTGDNIDEYNTEHKYITPIETVKKNKDYISEVISSGYLIENQRREQFKDVPSDTVSNDDKVFCVTTVEGGSYTLTGTATPLVWAVQFSSTNDTILINGSYQDIQVGDIIQLVRVTGSAPQEGLYNVTALSYTGNNTVISVSQNITLSGNYTDSWFINVNGTDRLRAARDEEFDLINNVVSSETSYNLGLNPKYMLLNQSPLINSGFNPKSGTDSVQAQDVKLNGDMQCRFDTGEGDYVLGAVGLTVTMDGSLTLDNLNGYSRLFTGNLIKFTASIGYDRVLTIRDAYLNQAVSDNFGYIRVSDGTTDYTGFLSSMSYNPVTEQVDFELIERYV